MKALTFSRYALGICVGAALLANCGGSQPIVPPGAALTQAQPLSQSSSYTVLYRFRGQIPSGPLLDADGTLYGTTDGTLYSISAEGKEKTLYHFIASKASGFGPYGPLADINGVLYGTTVAGGRCRNGVVYSLTTSGKETVLHSFCGNDGANPSGLANIGGTLYGTAELNAGHYLYGTLFRISTAGKFKVLYVFGSKTGDARGPSLPPIEVDGALYGTAQGGSRQQGAVYRASLSGEETVLYSFQGGLDGSVGAWGPPAGLTNIGKTLYGVTAGGGSHRGFNGRKDSCCGTFYSLSLSGKHSVLHSFTYHPGASFPNTTLAVMNGVLYGTSYGGGVEQRLGTVYSITRQGAEHVLYRFPGGTDGAHPDEALTLVSGKLYGTTDLGGDLKCTKYGLKVGCGVAFSFVP